MALKTLAKLDVKGKTVFLRTDFNVSLKKDRFGSRPTDDFRILASKPTIEYLRRRKCSIVIGTHLGRPRDRQRDLSLHNIFPLIKKTLGGKVIFANDIFNGETKRKISGLKPGEILVLENLRFWPGEKEGDKNFAKALAAHAQVYVNDAFGAVHRSHSSIVGLPKYLPPAAGLLLEKEVKVLNSVFKRPKRPLTFIMGGAKSEDKLLLIRKIIQEADYLILGGILANTFLKARGFNIGRSFYDRSAVKRIEKMKTLPSQVFLPQDAVVLNRRNKTLAKPLAGLGPTDSIFDIGPFSAAHFNTVIRKSKTVVWNGPVGFYEEADFRAGTFELAKTIVSSNLFSIIGGGDIIAFFNSAGLLGKVGHVSTGGGAMLEFLAGKHLPGLKALGYYN